MIKVGFTDQEHAAILEILKVRLELVDFMISKNHFLGHEYWGKEKSVVEKLINKVDKGDI